MSTLSVPLTPELQKFIEECVEQGVGANKADVVRKAILQFQEDQAVTLVLQAEQELREGKGLRGNLRDLAKKLK